MSEVNPRLDGMSRLNIPPVPPNPPIAIGGLWGCHSLVWRCLRVGRVVCVCLLLVAVVTSCVPEADTGIPTPVEVARITTDSLTPGVMTKDLDSDGLDELVMAQVYAGAYPYYEAGEVHLLVGPVQSRDLALSGADLVLRGQTAFKHFGAALAAADLDGDRYSDLVIASDAGLDGVANVVAVSGRLRGDLPLEASAFLTMEGPTTLGQAIAEIDYNGDGAEDLAVSCPARSEVYVVFGPRAGRLVLPDDADVVLEGITGSLGWTMSAGRFGPGGAMQLAIAEPVRETVYLVPLGLLGHHVVTEVASATIRSSDAMDNLVGCEGTVGPAEVGDRLFVRSRRADSEQIGTVFILTPPIIGDVDLRRDTTLTLERVHIGHTMSPAMGVPPLGIGPVLALGFPDQQQLPDSDLIGQVWVIPADLQGSRELNQAGLGRYWNIRAQDVNLNLFGITVRFASLTQPGAADLMVAANGAVVVYSWNGP